MSRNVPVRAEPYALKNKLRRIWRQFVRVMACIVVFCTTYAMILPAITMQRDTICGISEHTHGMLCYVQLTSKTVQELTCTYESLGVHVHTAECMDETGAPVCGCADYLVHTHDDRCGDACTLPEISEHTHSEACYNTHAHDEACYTAVPSALLCEIHVHGDGCYENGEPICGLTEDAHVHGGACYAPTLTCAAAEHTHADGCYDNGDPVCGVTEEGHVHEDICYAPTLTCGEAEHTHADGCYENGEPICGQTEDVHVHGDACYAPTLLCGEGDHTHGDGCYEEELVLSCGLEAISPEDATLTCGKEEVILHSHGDDCYDAETGKPVCGMTAVEAHSHTGPCFISREIPLDDMETLTCTETDENHLHIERCYGTWAMICGTEEHTHVESCYPAEQESEYDCGLTEHTHDDSCYDAEGALQCTLEPHSHAESGCGIAAEQEADPDVAYVNSLIGRIPSADEIDEKLAEFQAAGDTAGEEAWLAETYQDVAEAYHYYDQLSDNQKAALTDEQKLLDLEYIWSVTPYAEDWTYTWKAPTLITNAAHTSDFIQLNVYDYTWEINNKFWANQNIEWKTVNSSGKTTATGVTSKYPGFQWNGGAYMQSGTFNRYKVDFIDFGNSVVRDGYYNDTSTGVTDGKSNQAVAVAVNRNALNTDSGDIVKIINNINTIDVSSYGVTNRPVGMSLNGSAYGYGNDVLTRIATSRGYPALSNEVGGGSLQYLFGGEDVNYVIKQNKDGVSIDGLFQIDPVSGAYYFNSRENHAQLHDSDNDGYYDKFLLFKEFLTPNFIVYPFGNFLPFNSINNSDDTTYIKGHSHLKGYIGGQMITSLGNATDSSRVQLKKMLGRYRQSFVDSGQWDTITPLEAIQDYFWGGASGGDNPSDHTQPIIDVYNAGKIYNIDYDVATNFFFGMDMSMNFMQPKNGMTGNDNNGDGTPDYPMVFYFTGDDDVWVYIDGILFLDLSGIHRHVGGEIDFEKGEVRYYSLDTVVTGDVTGEPYQIYKFYDIVLQAYYYKYRNDGLTDAELYAKVNALVDPGTGRFRDYTTHNFHFFYTERGSGSSVCRMNFNFPLLRKNSISVAKELTADADVEMLGNPDFSFQILKANSATDKTNDLFIGAGVSYDIYDTMTNAKVGTGTTDSIGVFTLKAGQRAEFTGISENAGKYYVREWLPKDFVGQYGSIQIDGSSAVSLGEATVDGVTFVGRDSDIRDASSGTTVFHFNNKVTAAKLSCLTISKVVNSALDNREFDMKVLLNGEPIPVGTPYTLYDSAKFMAGQGKHKIADNPDRVVTEAGIVTVPGGATAEIDNLLPGTKFHVSEESDSADGYKVSYSIFVGQDEGWAEVVSDGVAGVIPVKVNDQAHVSAVVTNTKDEAAVSIPGTKTLSNGAADPDTPHTYSFTIDLVSINDNPPSHYDASYSQTKTVTVTGGDPQEFHFTINYLAKDFVKGSTSTLVYEIREDQPGGQGSTHDASVYTVAVVVTRDSSGQLSPAPRVTEITRNGTEVTSADFTNTLLGDLTLEKIVDGGALAQQNGSFGFTVQFGTNATTPLANWTVQAVKNGESAGTLTTDSSGYITLTGVKHGDKVELKGIPLGTVWRITESGTDGYIVDWTVNGTSGSSNVAEGDIPPSGAEVVYTNHSTYALPETGGIPIPYTMVGWMLMILSGGCLVYSKLKRRREAV